MTKQVKEIREACVYMASVFDRLLDGIYPEKEDIEVCVLLSKNFLTESGKTDFEEFGFIANSALWLGGIKNYHLKQIRQACQNTAKQFLDLAESLGLPLTSPLELAVELAD